LKDCKEKLLATAVNTTMARKGQCAKRRASKPAVEMPRSRKATKKRRFPQALGKVRQKSRLTFPTFPQLLLLVSYR